MPLVGAAQFATTDVALEEPPDKQPDHALFSNALKQLEEMS
jgi:hypothetical protein